MRIALGRQTGMLKRAASFRTDDRGAVPAVADLVPNTEYVICVEVPLPAVPTFRDRDHLVDWLDGAVLGDLRTLVRGINSVAASESTEAGRLGGGNFLLAAGCCMTIEYFGQVYGQGNNGTARAEAYVSRFLADVDRRYQEYFWLLWTSFRNGVVHGAWPQSVCVAGEPHRAVAIGANNQIDGEHFVPVTDHQGRSFVISSVRFFTDLEHSFASGFRDWILHGADPQVLDRAAARLVEIKAGNRGGVAQFNAIDAMQK